MSWSTEVSLSKLTMPQLLLVRAKEAPGRIAMRYKKFGIWNELNWQQVAERVKYAALGLYQLGFKKDDKLAILADNIPEWPLMELAIHSLRGVCVGIYASSIREEVDYFLDYCDISFAFCEDQEQSDKVIESKNIANIKKLIVEDGRGMREELAEEDDPGSPVMSWQTLLDLGRELAAESPKLFESLVAAGHPEDICTFGTTSGTTGKPKAVMLCHRNYLEMAYLTHQNEQFGLGDDYLSYLPYAWITEQFYGIAISLFCGVVINFPESADTAMSDLKEIGPHHMIGAPRVWEGVQSQVWVRMDESYPLNRWFYKRMLAIGQKAADYRMRGASMPLGLALGYRLAHLGLFRPLKDVLGFLRLKRAYTGGAALGPDTLKFFQAIGVNLKQLYGQTEAGITVYQPNGDVRHETVGKPLTGMDIKISPEGEVLVKSPGICKGYYKREDTFQEALTPEGYFRSGDAVILVMMVISSSSTASAM
ncbi:MAG: AMP-binding protein [Deinococcales bacterium]